MRDLGFEVTDTQIDNMLKEADTDGNGTLNFEEFAGVLNKVGEEDKGGDAAYDDVRVIPSS
jgi:Ca2+-binding EF-hand superfamily protein